MKTPITKRMLVDTVSIGIGASLTGTPFMFWLVHVTFWQWASWVMAVFINTATFGWLMSKIVDKFRKAFHVD